MNSESSTSEGLTAAGCGLQGSEKHPEEKKELARCRHRAGERWVVCVHTDKIELARPLRTWIRGYSGGAGVTWQVDGEAVCAGCSSALQKGRPPSRDLRLACGSCVRSRWPIEEMSNALGE